MRIAERRPRRIRAGVAWTCLALPLAAGAVLCAAYGAWPLALLEFLLASLTWVKAWAAFAGVRRVGPR